jgi:hypothetical protein
MAINDETGEEYTPLVSEPQISTAPAGGFSDFFGPFTQAAGNFAQRFTTQPTSTQNGIGGALYNAIYAFGAGKIDLARETAARALLNSRTGNRFVGEVEQQRLMQRLPLILFGGLILFGLVFMLARR